MDRAAQEIEEPDDGRARMVRRLRQGLGAHGIAQVVNLGIRLAEVPLFLAYWSVDRYGEWLIVATIPSYLAMADGGFTGATQREMTMRMGAGDRGGVIALFRSTWVLLLSMSVLIGVGVYGFTALAPLAAWLGITTMSPAELRVVVLLLTAHVLVSFQSGLAHAGYVCQGRYGRGTFFGTINQSLDFVGLAGALVLGEGPAAVALGLVSGRCLGLLVMLVDLAIAIPWLRHGFRGASKAEVVRLLRPSIASMAMPLSNALNIQGARLVVGMTLGSAAVAVFSALRTICRSALQMVDVVARLSEPEIALSYGAGKHDVVRMLFIRSSQLALWIALPASTLLWFLGEPIVRVWTHATIPMEPALFAFLLGASAVRSLWLTALMIPYATNRHERVVVFLLVSDVGMLVLASTLMPELGLAGAGAAVLAAEACTCVVMIRMALELTSETLGGWMLDVIRPPVSLLSAVFASSHHRR